MPVEITKKDGSKQIKHPEREFAQDYGSRARVLKMLPMWVGFVLALVISFFLGRSTAPLIEIPKVVQTEKLVPTIDSEFTERCAALAKAMRISSGNSPPFAREPTADNYREYADYKVLVYWLSHPHVKPGKYKDAIKRYRPVLTDQIYTD